MKTKKSKKGCATGGGLPGLDMIAPAIANLIPQAINIGQSANSTPVYDPQAKGGFDFGQMAGAAAASGGLGPLGIIAGGLNAVGQLVKSNKAKHTNVYGSPGQYASGGDMTLNNQAFKVNAPANKTDAKYYPSFDVNLDNNEVVDASRKIVYSDDIKNPTTGNSFATDAAKLEYKKGLSQKKVERYKDPFAANTIEALDRMGRELYSKQEVVATAMGKRDSNGSTIQGRAMGGPLDPMARESTYVQPLPMQSFNPSTVGLPRVDQLEQMIQTNRQQAEAFFKDSAPRMAPRKTFDSRYRERAYGGPIDPDPSRPWMNKPGMKDLYYDPYSGSTMTRRKDGKYFPYSGDFQGQQFFSPTEIQQHLKQYPPLSLSSNEWQGLSDPGMYSAPDSRAQTQVQPTTTSAYPNMRTATPPPTYGQDNITPNLFLTLRGNTTAPTATSPRPTGTRKSNSVQSSPTGPVNNPSNFSVYNGDADPYRVARPNMSATDPMAASAAASELFNPNGTAQPEYRANLPAFSGGSSVTDTSSATAAQTPTNSRSMFTTGDYLQMGAAAASFAPLLQGPQRETPYLDNTQITKQAFDVNPQLYQSGRSYRNAVNSIDTQSPNLRRALQNSLYAQKLNQDNQVVQQYQGINNQAQQQYEANLSNQRRYNIGQTTYTNDLNRRNEGAYNTSLDNAFRTVSNFGKGMNEKQQGQDVMNLFRTQYSDVYDRIIKALTSRD